MKRAFNNFGVIRERLDEIVWILTVVSTFSFQIQYFGKYLQLCMNMIFIQRKTIDNDSVHRTREIRIPLLAIFWEVPTSFFSFPLLFHFKIQKCIC